MKKVPKPDTAWFQGKIADLKLNQREVAQRLGMDPSQLSRMLRGGRYMLTIEAEALAKLLGVDVAEIIARANPKRNHKRGE